MRQGPIIRLFRPRESSNYSMYGQADGPGDQTVAVFQLPKRQWWWKLIEGPTFDE